MTTLTIGNSVTSIERSAFSGCSGLITVYWDAVNVISYPTSTSSHPFKNCTNLTTVVFGNQVQTIPAYAFYNCNNLTGTLTIPNTVTSIGGSAFYNCIGLEAVYYTGDIAQWCNIEFGNSSSNPLCYAHNLYIDNELVTDLVIPESVTEIKNYTFYGCTCLTNLTIPNSLTSIGVVAFSGCSGLTTVNWDAVNVTSYPTSTSNHPFKNCTNLTTVVFGNQVQTIPNYAFSCCSGLTTVNWNAVSVTNYPTSTNSHPFKDCPNLTTVVFGDQVQTIPNYAFYNCSGLESVYYTGDIAQWCNIQFEAFNSNPLYYAHNLYIDDELVTNLMIPESVTEIKNYAFLGCSCLTSLTIGNSVTLIGYYAFSGCSGLTGLTIPNSVTSIESCAFSGCSELTDLTIGNSVTSIGNYTFQNCDGLNTVNWNAVSVTSYPTSTSYHPFKNCTNLTTVVIGEQVQKVPNYAFYNCSNLNTVIWNAVNVTSYPTSTSYHPFGNCTNLTCVVIGEQVQKVPNYAFYNCSNLNTVIWNAVNVTSYPTSTSYHPFKKCPNLATVVFGHQVQTIPNSAFSGCNGLAMVNWNAVNVTSYPDSSSAFSNCPNLTTVVFGDQVQSIPAYAFYDCGSLTGTLMISDSVTSIGDYAFSNCTGINAIRLQCLTVPTITSSSFYNVNRYIPVFVPCGTKEAYRTANYWSEFTAINESPYDLIVTQNDPYGGEVSVVYADCEDNHCAILAQNNIGYNFVGWYIDDELLTGSAYYEFTIDDDVVLEARYSRNANHVIANGSTNTWSNPNTWDTGEVPSSTSIVGIFRDVIVDVDAEVVQMGVYDEGSITISSDVTLTVMGELESDTVTSIIIEDGGQLYHSNNGAMATVKKSIQPYTSNTNGWNLISFPLTGNGTVASIANMLSNRYDLYSYDEPTHYWINQKEEDNYFEALEEGKGYLYANSGSENVIYSFEDLNMDSWTTIDADGDGYNWEFTTTTAYTGTGCLQSSSWINETGRPLAPDNYIVSPQLMFNSSSSISFWASAQDTNYPADHFGVAVSTLSNTNPTDFTIIEEWTMTAKSVRAFGNWYQFTVDLGQFAGQIGYVALRHFNCIDQFRILVDEIRLSGVNLIEPQNVILSFVGELENGSATIMVPLNYTETVGNLKGFNLVGNPFVHNVTSYGSTNVADGCFRLNETKDNLIVSEVSETLPLKPAEGFFVKATAEGASITFNPGRSKSENERKGFVNLELRENGKLIDRLIVKREGEPLEKLMLKGNGTRLYALQDRQEIAIVPCEGDEQAVCFKADENGSYTINVSVNGFELDYLYLIDNLTGNDVNLLVEPSYSFEAKTTDYASRFKLVFATGSSEDPEGDSFAFFNSSGNLTIYGVDDEVTLQVVDVLGHVLSTERFSGSYEKKLNVAPGVYMLRLINGDDVKVQKIIIKN